MKTITAATAVAIACVLATSASATADEPTDQPAIAYPVYRTADAPVDGDTVIHLEAPGRSWGIRRSAHLMDAQVPGLTIRTSGTCAANPTAVCVRVEVGTYNPAQQLAISLGQVDKWQGVCVCPPEGTRTIYLNRYNSPYLDGWYKSMVSAHELGHALGLGHHTSKGATATTMNYDKGDLAPAEAAVLADWFAVPRYKPVAAG